jgi:hypothetical protein
MTTEQEVWMRTYVTVIRTNGGSAQEFDHSDRISGPRKYRHSHADEAGRCADEALAQFKKRWPAKEA